MKRAYKLQEFVAHASNVNCLKIGKKTSRVLVTGGEDAKVNMWAIGRPNPIMSLSGHSSAVESVTFDAAEALVAAGAASGTIKLWDLEEAKVVRTLTGHRSNCIAVDFHPFGEFFASGSLDTNLKIWDIRRKGCIHTYKGHTRGVNVLKFSPDGRWVVSGGEDNIVKLWDLTAGKLMHDFKCHEGQILCLDFHPHEFLLATGSADRTVKFWDLETFELIGSAGPEVSGARSMIFNPDGHTLLTGLHENLKVFSWEPSKCHDVVDVGWSKLADLNVHEGKLLACSYNQSCVGIWVVDLARVGPYAPGSNNKVNGVSAVTPPSQQTLDGSLKSSNITRSTVPHAVESSMKDMKLTPTLASENMPNTPHRENSMTSVKSSNMATSTVSASMPARRASGKTQALQPKIDPVPVVVPRSDHVPSRPVIDAANSRPVIPSVTSHSNNSRTDNLKDNFNSPAVDVHVSVVGRKSGNRGKIDVNFSEVINDSHPGVTGGDYGNVKVMETGKLKRVDSFGDHAGNDMSRFDDRFSSTRDVPYMNVGEGGRVRYMASAFDKELPVRPNNISGHVTKSSFLDGNGFNMKGGHLNNERSMDINLNDSDIIEQLLQPHHAFVSIMQSRLTKLQVIKRFWTKNDLKGAMEAISKMADQAVLVDVLTCMLDRSEAFTLEVCALLLPQLNDLLSSTIDRYLSTTLAALSLLVKTFGQMIHTTRTASPSFGVDLHAEERIERCNSCYTHLLAITESIKPLLRRHDDIGKSAQEVSIALQEV